MKGSLLQQFRLLGEPHRPAANCTADPTSGVGLPRNQGVRVNLADHSLLDHPRLEFGDGVVALAVDLVVRQVVDLHALVFHPAFGLALDEGRLSLRADIGQGTAGGVIHRQRVGAIDAGGGHEAAGGVGDVGEHVLADVRGDGEIVVFTNHQHWQFLEGGKVHALPEHAGVGGGIAEVGDGHAVLAGKFGRQGRADAKAAVAFR